MWKNDIRAPSVPTLRPLPSRTALLSSSMTNCVTTAMAKLRSGKMTRGMANFESTVVKSETGSDFQNRMLRSRRSPYKRVERVENPDNKTRPHDQSSREFVRSVERLVSMRRAERQPSQEGEQKNAGGGQRGDIDRSVLPQFAPAPTSTCADWR